MAKLSNVTESVFEFIYDQTLHGKKLHEFDIVSRFKPIIGQSQIYDVLGRLSKKHHILKTTSSRLRAGKHPTNYFHVNQENVYFPEKKGMPVSPEKLKQLERLRGTPFEPEEKGEEESRQASLPLPDTLVIDEQIRQTAAALPGLPGSAISTAWAALQKTPVNHSEVISLIGKGALAVDAVQLEENDNIDVNPSVMLLLDLGQSKSELVDAKAAYRLYLGLHALFGAKS